MMAEESLDPIFSMSPALLKKNLGIVPAKHTQEYPNNIIIKKLPCLGRIHFVRDREGITFLSCIVAYWVYGILSSYYCVLLPHYQDGRFPVGVIYYHLTVAALCLISLVRAATLNPGRVPLIDDTKLSENKDWVICQRCLRPKPERAHHCRRCQQCVMKMDHHCPWINNCVGEANHHVFVLLLFYAMMFGLNTFVFLMLHFWVWPKCQLCDHEVFYVKHGIWFHYLSTVMSAAMAFVMLTQLINQHWFIRMDTTTVESMKEQESKTYNKYIRPIHYKTSFKAYSDLFGTKIFCLWFFPCRRKPSSLEDNLLHV